MPGAATVADKPPPRAALAVLNPALRAMLSSPAGRLVPATFAVLEVTGRRTGRALRLVVGVHEVDDGLVVFSSRPWRLNFRGGAPVTVLRRGRRLRGTGTLVEDPAVVAAAFRQVLDRGTSPSMVGLDMERDHRLTADDVRALGRGLIRLDVDDAPPRA